MVIALGFLNLAEVPVASVEPWDPGEPARVVTAPVEITIFRILCKKNGKSPLRMKK